MTQDRPIKVFIVEGDKKTRTVIRFSFVACGDFDLEFCDSELEALRTVGDFAPDVVFLDASLPEESSRLTLQALRMLPEMDDVPVIFATGRRVQSEIDKLFELGASDVVARPFDPFAIPGQVLKTWEQTCA